MDMPSPLKLFALLGTETFNLQGLYILPKSFAELYIVCGKILRRKCVYLLDYRRSQNQHKTSPLDHSYDIAGVGCPYEKV